MDDDDDDDDDEGADDEVDGIQSFTHLEENSTFEQAFLIRTTSETAEIRFNAFENKREAVAAEFGSPPPSPPPPLCKFDTREFLSFAGTLKSEATGVDDDDGGRDEAEDDAKKAAISKHRFACLDKRSVALATRIRFDTDARFPPLRAPIAPSDADADVALSFELTTSDDED